MSYNKFAIVSKKGYESLNINMVDKKTYMVIIDGTSIQTEVDLIQTLVKAFNLPDKTRLWDQLHDWMTDLSWLDSYDGFLLIIENFEKMLQNENQTMFDFIDYFANYILPFWEEEVLYTNMGGKVKSFNVYCITNALEAYRSF